METQGFKFTLNNPGFSDLGPLIAILMSLAFAVAGIFFFAQLLIGGIRWISAGGDSKAVDSARDRITNALMGIILVVAAYAIILIIEKTLGIRIVSGINI